MKSVNILASTMNRPSPDDLLRDMRINKDVVIINQITDNSIKITETPQKNDSVKFLSFQEKGLSKSRNKAIASSTADICLIADDDMYYSKDFKNTVLSGFDKYEDADIIAFLVTYDNGKRKGELSEGRVGLLKSLKLSSVQLAFKRESIVQKDIRFDENFGAGAKYYMGEENIFLAECIKKGLKVYFVPKVIAGLREGESSWFKGHDKYNFNVRGRTFARISPLLGVMMSIRFAIAKRATFKEEVSPRKALAYMLQGYFAELISSHRKRGGR